MYEIEISKNKKIDIVDFAEVGAVLKKKTVEKEEFYIEISKEIENMYNIINISPKIKKNPKLNILAHVFAEIDGNTERELHNITTLDVTTLLKSNIINLKILK